MKKILLILSCLATAISAYAQFPAHKYDWAKSIGGTVQDKGTFITTDNGGNIYICGTFYGGDVDPGDGITWLFTHGGSDIFITKLDPGGNFLWGKVIGGTGNDYALSINADIADAIVITGSFSSPTNFDPAGSPAGLLNINGLDDIFVLRLDNFGNFHWVAKMGGIQSDVARAMTVDNKFNVLTVGDFKRTVDFNPNPSPSAVLNLTAIGESDVFACKLNNLGNLMWARAIGSDSDDVAYGITTNNANSSYIVGSFRRSMDFDPGPAFYKTLSAGNTDAFLTVLNEFGNFSLARTVGGPGMDVAYGVAVDDLNNIYITGSFQATADFNPSDTTTYKLTAQGNDDLFVTCLSATGKLKWAKNIGAPGVSCVGTSIKVDAANDLIITGSFSGTVDFDPGAKTRELKSNGSSDAFILKMDSSGAYKWAKGMGGSGPDTAACAHVDISGSIYTTGNFTDSGDFDPGWNTKMLLSYRQRDAFIHKMSPCTPDTVTIVEKACDSFMLENVKYTSTGTYDQVITGTTGCDRYVTLNLTVAPHVNDTVIKTGITLNSKEKGAKYQWVECPSYKILPGATASSYIAIGNGSYAVIVTNGICSDTSACMEVKDVPVYNGIKGFSQNTTIKIFPNPSNGEFTIETDESLKGTPTIIYNLLGQKVKAFELEGKTTIQTLDKGFYLIEFNIGDDKVTERIMVN